MITSDDRKCLWTKAVCSKVLTDVETSRLVDSFVNWDGHHFHGRTLYRLEKGFVTKLLEDIDILADRFVVAGCVVKEANKRNIAVLLLFHYRNNSSIFIDESEDVNVVDVVSAIDSEEADGETSTRDCKCDDEGDSPKQTSLSTKIDSGNSDCKPDETSEIGGKIRPAQLNGMRYLGQLRQFYCLHLFLFQRLYQVSYDKTLTVGI